MTVFREEKNENYTRISNHVFKDRNLSWKAKGILTSMLSLPDDWAYSMAGLATLASDGVDSTKSGLQELENHGYLVRKPVKEKGKIKHWDYQIYEKPQLEKPKEKKPEKEKPPKENPTQLKNNKSTTKESITNQSKTKERKDKPSPAFSPPTVEEVKAYCEERKNGIDPQRFVDFYASNGWMVGKNPMKDWKASIRTWESRVNEGGKENGNNSRQNGSDPAEGRSGGFSGIQWGVEC